MKFAGEIRITATENILAPIGGMHAPMSLLRMICSAKFGERKRIIMPTDALKKFVFRKMLLNWIRQRIIFLHKESTKVYINTRFLIIRTV